MAETYAIIVTREQVVALLAVIDHHAEDEIDAWEDAGVPTRANGYAHIGEAWNAVLGIVDRLGDLRSDALSELVRTMIARGPTGPGK